MNLKSVNEIDNNLKVILRMDLDIPIENNLITDNSRLQKSLNTIKILLDKKCKIIIVGHRGRPEGVDVKLSLKPVYAELMGMLHDIHPITSVFIEDVLSTEIIDNATDNNDLVFLENIRFWKGEEDNNETFRKYLASLGEAFVNDAFAVAHRAHASVMLHQIMPAFYGISFVEEANKIDVAVSNPRRPLLVLLGGAKNDKLNYLPKLVKVADKILIGGKLPKMIFDMGYMTTEADKQKILVAKLNENELDLSVDDLARFKVQLSYAKTIVWAGAMGFFESEESRMGTDEIARAIAEADAYKIVAGGDTGASILRLGLKDKIDFVCSGGGVMLEFLCNGKLVAWE